MSIATFRTIRNLAVAAATLVAPQAVNAGTTNFESFTVGQSVNGQGDWTVEDSFGNSAELMDEEVVDDGTGNKVWRMSNGIISGSYSSQPFSSKSAEVAGETGAGLYNDYGPSHTTPYSPRQASATATSKNFYSSWDFKSATGAAQPNLVLAVSAGASQSTLRMTHLQLVDSGSGFDVVFRDALGSTLNATTIASNLSYADWHSVETYVEFVDGIGPGNAGNDIVKVFVNGSLAHTGTTWESYFYTTSDGGLPLPAVHAVDSLLFRAAGTGAPATMGAGFYFDNVVTSNAAIPEPASLALAGAAALGLFVVRRRNAKA